MNNNFIYSIRIVLLKSYLENVHHLFLFSSWAPSSSVLDVLTNSASIFASVSGDDLASSSVRAISSAVAFAGDRLLCFFEIKIL